MTGTTAIACYWIVCAFFAYYKIPEEGLIILSVLLVIDIFTGIAKSYALRLKNEEKEYYPDGKIKNTRFKSNTMIIGLMAKGFLFIIVISLWLVMKANGLDGTTFISTFIGALCAATFISILQNYKMIVTGKQIEEFDAITTILNGILWLVIWKIKKIRPDLDK